MPEKVTSLNGLKVTLEYCSYITGAHNKDYVKYKYIKQYNQCVIADFHPTLPDFQLGKFKKQCPLVSL